MGAIGPVPPLPCERRPPRSGELPGAWSTPNQEVPTWPNLPAGGDGASTAKAPFTQTASGGGPPCVSATADASARRAGTEAAAYAELEKMRTAHGLGLDEPSADQLGVYLDWWLEMQAAKVGTVDRDMSPNTLVNYRWALGPIIAAHGGRRLRDLEPEHVEMVLARLAREGKSRRSIVRVRTVLGQALDTRPSGAARCHRNVARLAEMPRTAPPPEQRSLTVDQAAALLHAAKGDPARGVRCDRAHARPSPRGAARPALGGHRPRRRHPEVTGSLKREAGRRVARTFASVTSKRYSGLTAASRPARAGRRGTSAQRNRQTQERLLAGPEWVKTTGWCSPPPSAHPSRPVNMNRRLATVTERAGIGHWSLTELSRHSAASLMSAAGMPLEVIADVLGHSSTRMLEAPLPPPVRPSSALTSPSWKTCSAPAADLPYHGGMTMPKTVSASRVIYDRYPDGLVSDDRPDTVAEVIDLLMDDICGSEETIWALQDAVAALAARVAALEGRNASGRDAFRPRL